MWEEKENRMTDPRLHLKFQVPKNQKYDTDICENTNTLNKTHPSVQKKKCNTENVTGWLISTVRMKKEMRRMKSC